MENKTALVVDDEFHIVQVVSIKLKNNGFDVTTAENGTDAYDLACQLLPDIIITDYQMTGMTGLELIGNDRLLDGLKRNRLQARR